MTWPEAFVKAAQALAVPLSIAAFFFGLAVLIRIINGGDDS